jgi:hypothetical protein
VLGQGELELGDQGLVDLGLEGLPLTGRPVVVWAKLPFRGYGHGPMAMQGGTRGWVPDAGRGAKLPVPNYHFMLQPIRIKGRATSGLRKKQAKEGNTTERVSQGQPSRDRPGERGISFSYGYESIK